MTGEFTPGVALPGGELTSGDLAAESAARTAADDAHAADTTSVHGIADTATLVRSIVEGDNVTVDATDPANPVVSATGGGGGGLVTGSDLDAETLDVLTLTSGAVEAVPFDATGATINGADFTIDAGTPSQIAVSTRGLYAFWAEVDWATSASGTRRAYFGNSASANGFREARLPILPTQLVDGAAQYATAMFVLDAGDTVQLHVWQDSGDVLDVTYAEVTAARIL